MWLERTAICLGSVLQRTKKVLKAFLGNGVDDWMKYKPKIRLLFDLVPMVDSGLPYRPRIAIGPTVSLHVLELI